MKTIKINPILEKVERGAKLGAQLTGYKCNSKEKGVFKLASDLTAKHCYLVPEKDILHWEYLDEKEGLIKLYLEEETEVDEVLSRILYSHSPSSQSRPFQQNEPWFNLANSRLFTPLLPPLLLPVRNSECESECIKKIMKGEGFTKIFPGSSPNSAKIIRTPEGIAELRRCLRDQCGYWGFILEIAYNEAVAQIQGTVTVSKDPDFPDVPPFQLPFYPFYR